MEIKQAHVHHRWRLILEELVTKFSDSIVIFGGFMTYKANGMVRKSIGESYILIIILLTHNPKRS